MLDLSWNHGDGTEEDGLRVEACGSFHCFLKKTSDREISSVVAPYSSDAGLCLWLPFSHDITPSNHPSHLTLSHARYDKP